MPILDDGYIEFDVYFQPDLDQQCCQSTCDADTAYCWRYLVELWEDNNGAGGIENSRVSLTINRNNATNDQWEWSIGYDEDTTASGWGNVWTEIYTTSAVADGVWQEVGFEWVRDTTNGHLKLWVDDTLLLSRTSEETSSGDEFFFLDLLMVYTNSAISCTSESNCSDNSSWQYIDNLKICESRESCQ
jgi:hypothetical protein